MEKAKQLFDSLVKDALDGELETIFSPEKTQEFIEEVILIGKQKTNTNQVSDGTILTTFISSLLVGKTLEQLNTPAENISQGVSLIMGSNEDVLYFIFGCLALISENPLDFEGKEVSELLKISELLKEEDNND